MSMAFANDSQLETLNNVQENVFECNNGQFYPWKIRLTIQIV